MTISQYMTQEHRECDDYFAASEGFTGSGNWEEAEKKFLEFSDKTLLHFKKEEEDLFPTFEEQSGSTEGPTKVMRFEHDQVRGLIGKMSEAIQNKDKDIYLSLAESMMILLQQHNMKEEQMLYSMCDRMIPAEQKDILLDKMKQVNTL